MRRPARRRRFHALGANDQRRKWPRTASPLDARRRFVSSRRCLPPPTDHEPAMIDVRCVGRRPAVRPAVSASASALPACLPACLSVCFEGNRTIAPTPSSAPSTLSSYLRAALEGLVPVRHQQQRCKFAAPPRMHCVSHSAGLLLLDSLSDMWLSLFLEVADVLHALPFLPFLSLLSYYLYISP
jgi:hypothetical protein